MPNGMPWEGEVEEARQLEHNERRRTGYRDGAALTAWWFHRPLPRLEDVPGASRGPRPARPRDGEGEWQPCEAERLGGR